MRSAARVASMRLVCLDVQRSPRRPAWMREVDDLAFAASMLDLSLLASVSRALSRASTLATVTPAR